MQSDGLNTALSPVVYGDFALSINTQYNTIQLCMEDKPVAQKFKNLFIDI